MTELRDNPNLVLNPVRPFETVDFTEIVANEKAKTVGMKVGSIYGMVGGLKVELFKTDVFKRGPKKGQTKWLKEGKIEVLLTSSDIDATEHKWAAETGRCPKCFGNKLVWQGWVKGEGNYFGPCKCTKEVPNEIPG